MNSHRVLPYWSILKSFIKHKSHTRWMEISIFLRLSLSIPANKQRHELYVRLNYVLYFYRADIRKYMFLWFNALKATRLDPPNGLTTKILLNWRKTFCMNIVLAPLIFGFHLSEVFILAQNRSSSLHSESYP